MWRDRDVTGEFSLRVFGRGGMRLLSLPRDLWEEMLSWGPTAVFLRVGGNEINYDVQASQIAEEMLSRVGELRNRGIHVFVGEVLPRANFRGNIDYTGFEKIRKGVNNRLRRFMAHDFIFLRVRLWDEECQLHGHHSQDGVHLYPLGQAKYHGALVSAFSWLA